MNKKTFISLSLVAILSIPAVRNSLVETMIGQMVIQIPLLAFAGYLLGMGLKLRRRESLYNSNGISGLLIAVFSSTFWLLPRSLDAALNFDLYELLKYITVPIFIGLPLALSWGRLPSTVKGFVWANMISMLFVMGWFYANAPIRICNNYLTEQQTQLGMTLMGISLFFFLSFFCKAFFFGLKNNH